MSSNSQLSAPKKLLSLDGGRVRGISSMVILREIMNKVKELEQGKKIGDDSERLPCRYFDLAGGASTGGLAAIMLFRLEMSAPDVIDQYEGMATRIFSKKDEGPFHENGSSTGNWGIVYNIFYWIFIILGGSYYSGLGLVEAVNEVAKIRERKGKDAPLLDNSKPKMYVDSTNILPFPIPNFELFTSCHLLLAHRCQVAVHNDPRARKNGVIRSYAPPQNDDDVPKGRLPPGFWKDITLHEAERATTSAPFYFPFTLSKTTFERVWDARYELGNATGKPPQVSLVVSLGTAKGQPDPIAPPATEKDAMIILKRFLTRPGSAVQRFLTIIDLATNTEEPHRDFEQRMYYRNSVREDKTHYFRFNAEIDKDRCIKLENVKGMKGLREDTETLLRNSDVQEMVNKCAEQLVKNPE